MTSFRLPVSGVEISLREPTGVEEAFLAESGEADGFGLALWLVAALARTPKGEDVAADALSVTDLDVALLTIRRETVGDGVRCTVRCECREAIDIEFTVSEYLEHHAPRRPRALLAAGPDWYRFNGADVTFRVPSCADVSAIVASRGPDAEYLERCFRPKDVGTRDRRRAESAMESLAPSLYGTLEGRCPGCDETVQIRFDPLRYVLRELRQRASSVFEDVHVLARDYHWSERDVLAMDRGRRGRYVDFLLESPKDS